MSESEIKKTNEIKSKVLNEDYSALFLSFYRNEELKPKGDNKIPKDKFIPDYF